ncbi:MAG: sarcosine oxidase subunit gamma family protein [Betaproteobacteria bacterium]
MDLVELMSFKGREETLVAAMRTLDGVELPRSPRRIQGRRFACTWAGPARWLLEIQSPGQVPLEDLGRSLVGVAALVRQTDGRALLRISGPRAREVLRKGLSVDLHPRSFRVGHTAITLVAGIDVQLWQLDDAPTYELLINRSVAGSFWHWLVSAAAEFGLDCETTD